MLVCGHPWGLFDAHHHADQSRPLSADVLRGQSTCHRSQERHRSRLQRIGKPSRSGDPHARPARLHRRAAGPQRWAATDAPAGRDQHRFRLPHLRVRPAVCRVLQRLQYLPLVEACWLRNAIRDAVDAFYRSPDKVLPSDLVDGNDRLAELLHFEVQSCCSRTAPQRNGRRRRKAKDQRCWTTRQSPEVIRPPHELIDKRQHPSALQHIISCLPE